MYKRRIAVCVSIIMMLTLSVLVASNHPPKSIVKELEQPAKAQFVLAEWDFPDEYGQGIWAFMFYENSTGSWLPCDPYSYEYNQSYTVEWNASVFIKLRCFVSFNSTLTGAIDTDDGKNYLRHSVTVTNLGTTVFSQQNFTYFSNDTQLDPIWYYGYDVVLNFLPVAGEIYTVVVTYEIYW